MLTVGILQNDSSTAEAYSREVGLWPCAFEARFYRPTMMASRDTPLCRATAEESVQSAEPEGMVVRDRNPVASRRERLKDDMTPTWCTRAYPPG